MVRIRVLVRGSAGPRSSGTVVRPSHPPRHRRLPVRPGVLRALFPHGPHRSDLARLGTSPPPRARERARRSPPARQVESTSVEALRPLRFSDLRCRRRRKAMTSIARPPTATASAPGPGTSIGSLNRRRVSWWTCAAAPRGAAWSPVRDDASTTAPGWTRSALGDALGSGTVVPCPGVELWSTVSADAPGCAPVSRRGPTVGRTCAPVRTGRASGGRSPHRRTPPHRGGARRRSR